MTELTPMRALRAARIALAAVVLSAGLASSAPTREPAVQSGPAAWREIRWPLPFDPWGTGRAFVCAAEACGQRVELYLRPKIGFCNCTTGITEDEEIARVSDVEAVGADFAALSPGHVVAIGTMRGRAQHFSIRARMSDRRYALGVVASYRCDVVTATLVGTEPIGPRAERMAFDLMNGSSLLTWAEASLGAAQ
jgi:hypothetical protein